MGDPCMEKVKTPQCRLLLTVVSFLLMGLGLALMFVPLMRVTLYLSYALIAVGGFIFVVTLVYACKERKARNNAVVQFDDKSHRNRRHDTHVHAHTRPDTFITSRGPHIVSQSGAHNSVDAAYPPGTYAPPGDRHRYSQQPPQFGEYNAAPAHSLPPPSYSDATTSPFTYSA